MRVYSSGLALAGIWLTVSVGIVTSTASAVYAAHAPAHPAGAYAQVVGGTGPISFEQKSVKVGSFISLDGTVRTAPSGRAKIYIWDTDTTVSMGSNAEVRLVDPKHSTPEAAQESKLLKGVARWATSKNKSPDKKLKLTVRSHNAVMGVRGTDFLTTFNPLLDETEIVVFEGTVAFGNELEAPDALNITSGQWGGIGGRFGQKVHGPIDLPQNALDNFRESSEIHSVIAGGTEPTEGEPAKAKAVPTTSGSGEIGGGGGH